MGIEKKTVLSPKFTRASLPTNFESSGDGSRKEDREIYQHEEWLRRAKEKGALDVPLDPQAFYEKLGLIPHPMTRKPIKKLADYQIEISKSMQQRKFNIVVKSQKSGITTSVLMTDFQFAILPYSNPLSCRGQEILIIAQSMDTAKQHIDTLRQMIAASDVYDDYLIRNPIAGLNRDQVSKVERLYIYNPSDYKRPTRIIGLGSSESSVWSWKQVKHIHISDIAIVDEDVTGTINAALSRLANTDGSLTIETPPKYPTGKVYEIWNAAHEKKTATTSEDSLEGQFYPLEFDYTKAMAAGVISEKKIQEYKAQFGSEFARYFGAKFIAGGGNVFNPEDVDRAEILGKGVDYINYESGAAKAMGIDPGFGSSKFAIVISQANNGRAEIIYAREFANSTPTLMLERAAQMAQRYYVNRIYIDGSNPGYYNDLKALLDDNPDGFKQQLRELEVYHDNFRLFLKRAASQNIRVLPIQFGPHGKEMLTHAQAMLSAGRVAIHPDFGPLLQQMRSATEVNRDLEKSSKNPLDLIDALRLNLLYYNAPIKKTEI
jgi:hypothetical protein